MCKQEQTKGLTVPRNGYISTSSQASNKLGRFFPSSIKNEPVVTPAGIGNKIVHEADHPKKLEFEELEKNLSFLEPDQPVHDEIPRDNPSSSYKRSIVEPKMRTGALRIRAINAPPSPLRRPNRSHTHSDNPRRASLRPSTLYRELKRNEYYWF